MEIVFVIQLVVLLSILVRVSCVGVEGLIKSVRRVTCLNIPGGNVPEVIAVSIMCLWCMA